MPAFLFVAITSRRAYLYFFYLKIFENETFHRLPDYPSDFQTAKFFPSLFLQSDFFDYFSLRKSVYYCKINARGSLRAALIL